MIYNSVGGGTGSGFGNLLLERLALEYGKKSKLGIHVFPSASQSAAVTEPYNSILATHGLIENTDVNIMLDNTAL